VAIMASGGVSSKYIANESLRPIQAANGDLPATGEEAGIAVIKEVFSDEVLPSLNLQS